jgi:uncharacterized LabA/DUF88 family protein
MRTIVYVDGFNLYYRMLKDRPACKWLNPVALAQQVLQPQNNIIGLNYYIARVSARAHDPNAPARQVTYLSALGTVPQISVHEGSFITSNPWMSLTVPLETRPNGYVWNEPAPSLVRVVKSEEKGSDVNLAAHLVRDAFTDAFDVAAIITNDTDLVEPIRIAVQEAGKVVGLLAPVKFPSQSLMDVASFYRRIRKQHLKRSLFPSPIVLADGTELHKPATWV